MKRTNGCLLLWGMMAACLVLEPIQLFAQSDSIIQRRVAILPIGNSTAFPQLTSHAEGVLTDFFVNSGRFEVVERAQLDKIIKEQALGMTGAADAASAASVGKLLGAKYVVLGQITQASLTHSEKKGDKPNYEGRADLDIRLVNTESGSIVFSKVARGSNSPTLSWIAGTGADSIEVITGAVKIAAKEAMKALDNAIPIEGYVMVVKDSAHMSLDVGKTGGIKKGMKLKIFREGPPMKHPVTGQMVPGIKEWLAEVEVTLADETNSEAKVTKWTLKPAKPIQVGDKFRTSEK